jgi:hypothetical protein
MYMMVGHLTFDEATDTLECDFRLEAPKVAGREVCAKSDGILFFLAPEGIPAIRLWLRLRAKLLASKGRADHGHLFVSDGLSHALFSHSLLLSLALTALHTTPPPPLRPLSLQMANQSGTTWCTRPFDGCNRNSLARRQTLTRSDICRWVHGGVGGWVGGWVHRWVLQWMDRWWDGVHGEEGKCLCHPSTQRYVWYHLPAFPTIPETGVDAGA